MPMPAAPKQKSKYSEKEQHQRLAKYVVLKALQRRNGKTPKPTASK
jgi:hypothetical protein